MRVRLNKIVHAHEWNRNGDHPHDSSVVVEAPSDGYEFWTEGHVVRYFRRPQVDGKSKCDVCNKQYHIHGWLDTGGNGQKVCPGDIIIWEGGDNYDRISNDEFVQHWEVLSR